MLPVWFVGPSRTRPGVVWWGLIIIWDNRCVLHRAMPYDTARYKRLMQRTAVSGEAAGAAAARV